MAIDLNPDQIKAACTKSGVYCIRNLSTGDEYVGSSINIKKRWGVHKNALRKGRHHSRYLQNAWKKYGETRFVFSVISYCDKSQLLKLEQCEIDCRHPRYNMYPTAGSPLGHSVSAATRAKISRGHVGLAHTEETRKKMSVAHSGKVLTKEHRAKIGESQKGRRHTP